MRIHTLVTLWGGTYIGKTNIVIAEKYNRSQTRVH